MRWTRGSRSENLEDRRGEGGGGLRLPRGRGGLGLGGILIVLAIAYFTGQNPLTLLGALDDGSAQGPLDTSSGTGTGAPVQESAAEAERADFMSFVLDDAQSTWTSTLPDFRNAKLALFREGVSYGCGNAQSAMGPFYCPADKRVYEWFRRGYESGDAGACDTFAS